MLFQLLSLNDRMVQLPMNIEAVTAEQKIQYKEQFGDYLTMKLQAIREMPQGDDREIELTAWRIMKSKCDFSFFAEVSLDAIEESRFRDIIASMLFGKLPELIEQPYPADPLLKDFSLT